MIRNLLFLLLFLVLASPVISQNIARNTNGLEEYWDPNERRLFEIFRFEYWKDKRVNHYKILERKPLLVRLLDESTKIDAYRRNGRAKRANKMEANVRSANETIVSAMKADYTKGEFYFYYPKDADAIFKNKDYSKLYLDENTLAKNVEIEDVAYVLLWRNLPRRYNSKSFVLHLWEGKKLLRIRGYTYTKLGLFRIFDNPFNSINTFIKAALFEKQ